MKRAQRAHQDGGNLPRAARCAFWAGINLALRGRASHAGGWFGRALELVLRPDESWYRLRRRPSSH